MGVTVLLIVLSFLVWHFGGKLYNMCRYPKEGIMLAEAKYKGVFEWQHKLNWSYVYLFSTHKVARVIFDIAQREPNSVFEIGTAIISLKETELDCFEEKVIKALGKYRRTQLVSYNDIMYGSTANEFIYKMAKEIQKKESMEEIKSILKAFWLVYGFKNEYRRTLFNYINNNCKKQNSHKEIFEGVKELLKT